MSELHEKILDKYSFECCQCDEYKSTYLIHESNLKNIINLCMDAAIESVDSCKSTCYIDGPLEYVAIPLAQAKSKIQSLKEQDNE